MDASRVAQKKPQQSSSQDSNKNTKNFMWNEEKSAYLINCLVEEAARGMKVDKSFKRQAFVAAAKAVSEKFGESCNWTKVENRLKTLKKQWGTITQLKNLSGSNFDPVKKIITLGDGSYQDFLKAHPKDAIYLNVPIKFYEELVIICGDNQATGEFALDDINQANLEDIGRTDEDDDIVDNIEVEDTYTEDARSNVSGRQAHSSHQRDSQMSSKATTSGGKSDRKKRRVNSEMQALVGTLGKIAEHMVDPRTRQKEQLLAAIKPHTNFSEDVHLAAYTHCLNNQIEADIFLARSSQSQEDWLYNFMV